MTQERNDISSHLADSVTGKEVEIRKNEVVIDQRLLTLILEKVKLFQEKNQEFFVYLLGKEGVATMAITVGSGYGTGVSFSTAEVISKLSPYINMGFKILADLHNHPDTGLYASIGYPFESVTTPSVSDFDSPTYSELPERFDQVVFPRVIVAYDKTQDKYAINAFYQNRDLTPNEITSWTTPEPNFVPDEPDELGIVMLPDRCMNPEKLIENGVITLLNIHAVLEGKVEVIENCLRESEGK